MRLEGLDGGHLLGFLAAIGLLRLLDEDARERAASPPGLAFDTDCIARLARTSDDRSVLVEAVRRRLAVRAQFYCGLLAAINKPADFTPATFADFARRASDWQLAALAGLACTTGDDVFESSLCAANGASHQELVRSMRDVLALVDAEHVEAAIFRPWAKGYAVPEEKRKTLGLGTRKPTLRLDPADERLYALRAENPTPSTSVYKTELGAHALAIPAFELVPVCPSRRPTCIASRREPGRVTFEWTLWARSASLDTVRSLLASGAHDMDAARGRGAFAAFAAARVTGEKGKLSIAPTVGLW